MSQEVSLLGQYDCLEPIKTDLLTALAQGNDQMLERLCHNFVGDWVTRKKPGNSYQKEKEGVIELGGKFLKNYLKVSSEHSKDVEGKALDMTGKELEKPRYMFSGCGLGTQMVVDRNYKSPAQKAFKHMWRQGLTLKNLIEGNNYIGTSPEGTMELSNDQYAEDVKKEVHEVTKFDVKEESYSGPLFGGACSYGHVQNRSEHNYIPNNLPKQIETKPIIKELDIKELGSMGSCHSGWNAKYLAKLSKD